MVSAEPLRVTQPVARPTAPDAHQGDEDTEQDDIHDDTLSEVVMAIDMTPRGTVGCCYYVAREEKLYFMEDIQVGDAGIVESREYFFRTELPLSCVDELKSRHLRIPQSFSFRQRLTTQ
jgi:hypothetical protein